MNDPDYYGDHRNVTINNITPKNVIRPSTYNPNVFRKLKPYSQPFLYPDGLNYYKATSNTTREVFLSYQNSISHLFSVYDVSNGDSYAGFLVQSDNLEFPHETTTNITPKTYVIILRLASVASEIEATGSYDIDTVAQTFGLTAINARSRIFASSSVCTKGLIVTKNGYLTDLINGGIIYLRGNPNFFQDALLKTGAEANGFSFYSPSTNRIGYLAVNRA